MSTVQAFSAAQVCDGHQRESQAEEPWSAWRQGDRRGPLGVVHLRSGHNAADKRLQQLQIDGSNENGFGEQHPSLATMRGLLETAEGRRLVIHNGDISYAR